MQAGIPRQLASFVKEDPPATVRYVFAVSSTLAALLLTGILSSALEGTYLFLALTAIMMSSLYGGLGPALAASVVASAAISPLFGANEAFGGALAGRATSNALVFLFLLVAVLVSLVGSSVRSTRVEVEAARHNVANAAGDRIANEGEKARLVSELEGALRARDEFLSIASHELKTPITTLQLQVQSLLRVLRRERDSLEASARLGVKLASIERQVGRLTGLINILLDVSNIMAGRLRMRLERVDLTEVAREALAHLRESPCDTEQDIRLDAEGPVVGLWDRHRLEGIVTNLLSNAVKYGCGRPIEVSVRTSGATARLEVRDYGIGIAPSDQARIFERFERAVPEQYGGMGVGLWIVKETVEALGGTVAVKSDVGAGATFCVELPTNVGESHEADFNARA